MLESVESDKTTLSDQVLSASRSVIDEQLQSMSRSIKEIGMDSSEEKQVFSSINSEIEKVFVTAKENLDQEINRLNQTINDKIKLLNSKYAQLGSSAPSLSFIINSNNSNGVVSLRYKINQMDLALNDVEAQLAQRENLFKKTFDKFYNLLNKLFLNKTANETENVQYKEMILLKDKFLPYFNNNNPSPLTNDVILSLEQLSTFNDYVAIAQLEVERRINYIHSSALSIITLINDLGLPFQSNTELLIKQAYDTYNIDGNTLNKLELPVDDDFVNKVEERLGYLTEEKNRVTALVTNLASEISSLWTLVKTPLTHQKTFLSTKCMSSSALHAENIKACQEELANLKITRKQMLPTLINDSKIQVAQLWNELNISDSNRALFLTNLSSFNNDDESALNYILDEKNKLSNRAISLRPVLAAINKKRELDFECEQKDEEALNPKRYLRTNYAMEETKFRIKYKKLMPILLNDIDIQIAKWEQEHNEKFLWEGEIWKDYLNRIEKEKNEKKEADKLARKLAKTNLINTNNSNNNMVFTTTPSKDINTPRKNNNNQNISSTLPSPSLNKLITTSNNSYTSKTLKSPSHTPIKQKESGLGSTSILSSIDNRLN